MSLPRAVLSRLDALAGRYGLPAHAAPALAALLELGATDPAAPTAVTDPAEAVDRHVADSLVALELPEVREGRRIADIGAGAGWPGFALATALPDARVAVVESASRHCRYLERAVAAAGLPNVEVVHARAEAWPEGIGAHDLVTARALAALPVLCEYAAPLLAEGGSLVAWKAAVSAQEDADGEAAAAALGLTRTDVRRVEPFSGARDSVIYVYRKAAPTPPRFPRRPGVATKRPLSASS